MDRIAMTKARLIDALNALPDDVLIMMRNESGELTTNINFWFQNVDGNRFVELIGGTDLFHQHLFNNS